MDTCNEKYLILNRQLLSKQKSLIMLTLPTKSAIIHVQMKADDIKISNYYDSWYLIGFI